MRTKKELNKIIKTINSPTKEDLEIIKRGKILHKALKIAEKNGYKAHLGYLPIFISRQSKILSRQALESLMERIWQRYANDIIFSHAFAKAFFNEKWAWCLQEMVIIDKPLLYIERYLKNKGVDKNANI